MVEAYRRMLRIRLFEEKVIDLVKKGLITGGVHSSLGQEAETVGACLALAADDYMVGNHRSHGHPIAKGTPLRPLMAELLGRRTGICKGKGGSMHLADFSRGSLGESGIVGGGLPIAAGAGLSAKTRQSGQVCLCFFGDGAANQGAVHEAFNLSGIWSLPVVFLCENNQYAVTTPTSYALAGGSVANRAAAYGFPGAEVDGQDPVAVYAAVQTAAARARDGQGPTLVEALTYRFQDHAEFGGLEMPPYRSAEEVADWRARDPVPAFRLRLEADKVLSPEQADRLEAEIRAEVDDAVQFAKDSPYPDLAETWDDLYANPIRT